MRKLTELRSLLSATTREMGSKGATSKDIVAAFRKKYPSQIGNVSDQLIDIALTKLISEVSNRRPKGIAAGQIEMFSEYGVPGMIAIRVADEAGVRYVHKTLAKTLISEVKQYLNDHAKPRAVSTEERRELRRLVKDLEPYKKSDASTLEECWKASQAKKKTA